jgi:pimeloyl-ACP methyl ester carboxylesterase
MAQLPQTQYAKGPGGDIAYQVVGDGPMDLVVVPGWFSHVDLLWNHPGWASFIGDFASFSRVILYDKLGTGLSDPVDAVPTLESRVDDLRAVMDAAGSQRAALFGLSEGGPISMLFAATYPKRVQALILYGTYACGTGEDDGSPGRAKWIKLMNAIRPTLDHWGGGHTVDWAAPSLQPSAPYRTGMGALERAGMSPKMARLTFEAVLTQVDVRDILGSVRVPTLVLHRKDEAIPVEFAREIAAQIPSANWSSSTVSTICPRLATSSPSQARWNSSSPVSVTSRRPTACWPQCFSPTSSIRRDAPPNWATEAGASCSGATTRSHVKRSADSKVAR